MERYHEIEIERVNLFLFVSFLFSSLVFVACVHRHTHTHCWLEFLFTLKTKTVRLHLNMIKKLRLIYGRWCLSLSRSRSFYLSLHPWLSSKPSIRYSFINYFVFENNRNAHWCHNTWSSCRAVQTCNLLILLFSFPSFSALVKHFHSLLSAFLSFSNLICSVRVNTKLFRSLVFRCLLLCSSFILHSTCSEIINLRRFEIEIWDWCIHVSYIRVFPYLFWHSFEVRTGITFLWRLFFVFGCHSFISHMCVSYKFLYIFRASPIYCYEMDFVHFDSHGKSHISSYHSWVNTFRTQANISIKIDRDGGTSSVKGADRYG